MKTLALNLVAAVVLSWSAPSNVFGQMTRDFSSALELAKKHNPDWRAAEQEIDIARGKLTTASLLSPFNPVIQGEGGRRTIPGEGKGTDYSVGVSMELEVAGQRSKRVAEADTALKKAQASFGDFERTFKAKLARAFYQALFARQRLDLLRKVEGLNRQLSGVTKTKFDAGDVSGLELSVAQVRYSRSRKQAFDAERDLVQALLELKRLIGVEETILPKGTLEIVSPPLPPRNAMARALKDRPDLLAKRYELQRAEAEIALRRRQIFPNPTFGLSFTREGTGDKILLGGVSIPLPVFNRAQGELESLEARKTQARAELSAQEKEIRKEVDRAVNQWQVAQRNVDLFKREVIEQTEENFRLLEAAYRERKIDLPQLLVMENDLISANQDYLEVLLALRDAAIGLEEVTATVP